MTETAWLHRVAVTTCLDRLRAQMRRPELRWADLTESEAEMLDAVLTTKNEPHPGQALAAREVVGKLMDALSPTDRLVVQLLDLEERSIAEIQAITGWNATLIKVRAFRARHKMKKHLAQMEKAERHARK